MCINHDWVAMALTTNFNIVGIKCRQFIKILNLHETMTTPEEKIFRDFIKTVEILLFFKLESSFHHHTLQTLKFNFTLLISYFPT